MKKVLVALLLVLAISTFSVYALDGFSFYAGLGYDVRAIKEANDSAQSFNLELGTKYPIGSGFNAYGDVGLRFVGKGKIAGTDFKKGLFGVNVHAGVLYGMRFVDSPEFETYVGGGLTFSNTSFTTDATHSVFNIGAGLKFIVAYRINDDFALAISETPDLYFYRTSQFKVGLGNVATFGALFKF